MAVSVSRDLTVHVLEDTNTVKLSRTQQELRAAIQRGEPKCLGLSQVMLGLIVMSYSLPLHLTEHTYVVIFGVPWWTGLMFVAAGSVTILLDKRCTMKILQVCFTVSVVTLVLSVAAVIVYSVDLEKFQEIPCDKTEYHHCGDEFGAKRLSRRLKSSLLFFTLVQTVISIICCLLFRQRRIFAQYSTLRPAASNLNDVK